MPKRTDIKKILIIGAGPIIIGQACEFDYSGTQACKALKEEGYEIVLINSNPATIMTDPELADATYIEPVNATMIEMIIEKERPDAILPTIGGQTGLNTAIKLVEKGILEKYNVEIIGASIASIKKAEDRNLFRQAMGKIGLKVAKSGIANKLSDVKDIAKEIGFPVILRPSFTLGGTGGGVAYNTDELEKLAKKGLEASIINQIMLEESVVGWKEFELELMRDHNDNVVVICSIENIDPMGVHTGDSITVAPIQTLTDKQYQKMRDASIAIMREIGVDTGGSNVQFAVNPKNGEMLVVEMNPRVSRSSALASKATGFPIAKIAAKLAVGYTLDEIPNDITGQTLASFEPTLDYCVVKIPRFTFEKFPNTPDVLTTSMKSVGETMSIGRTFKEAFQKGIRSLEVGKSGFYSDNEIFLEDGHERKKFHKRLSDIKAKLATPNSRRIFYVKEALIEQMSIDEIYKLSGIDPWFIYQLKDIVEFEEKIKNSQDFIKPSLLKRAKAMGFSDAHIAKLSILNEKEIKKLRKKLNILPTYKLVDTCAAEFEAKTPYYYSTYEEEDESRVTKKKKVIILGGGPNRIGQGIEFDYCCVHAAFALKEENFESIMVNSNPETVSTDYDISDKLYFEPLTKEDVLHIIEKEKPYGVIVQFGGQTPLNLANQLHKAGANILGTIPKNIDKAEDRQQFQEMLTRLKLVQPLNGIATTIPDAAKVAKTIGYPVIVRPSYVLGGRAMNIVYNKKDFEEVVKIAIEVAPGLPVLIDKFLEYAIEIDVDAIADGETAIVAGIMEHIEEAGIHSGDSACVLPPQSISGALIGQIVNATKALAFDLQIKGLLNIQYAIKDNQLYIIEVNPRASRTIPFVSKATGIPFAKLATKIMLGRKLKDFGLTYDMFPAHISVKEAVLPFDRFPGVDTLLGPEMKSTGEVMGLSNDFGRAYAKAQLAAKQNLPASGTVFISVNDKDKNSILAVAGCFMDLGFKIISTEGTSNFLQKRGIKNMMINKVSTGRPHIVDAITNGEVQLIINTGSENEATKDGYMIRRAALKFDIPYTTTIAGAIAISKGIVSLSKKELNVKSLQEYHKKWINV